jgi:heptosyltransferase-2
VNTEHNAPLNRLLVVKLADIGDVLTATPALRSLRRSLPGARVDLLTTPAAAAIVPGSLVDHVWTAPRGLAARPADLPALARLLLALRQGRYDAVIFLHHLTLRSGVLKYRLLAAATGAPVLAGLDNGKGAWLTHPTPDAGFGARHEVEYGLQVVAALGAHADDVSLAARCDAADRQHAAHLVALWPPGLRIALHPGSGGYSRARRWDPAKWASVADALILRYGAQVVLVGTPADGADEVQQGMRLPVTNLARQTTLPQLAALLGQCDLFLGADSGVMHLAAAAGVPVVALFGPSNHLAWGPWTRAGQSKVVRLGVSCSPCSYVGHGVGLRDGCWHRSCMADLEPARVLAAVESLLMLA